MDRKEYIASVVERNRSVWGIVMVLLTIAIIIWGSAWWLILLAAFGVMSYFAMITATQVWLESVLPDTLEIDQQTQLQAVDELNRRVALGETGPEIDELKRLAGIKEDQTVFVSDEIIGRYMDTDIHATICIKNGDSEQLFEFHEVTPRDKFGNLTVPQDGGTYAHFQRFTYRKVST